MARQMKKSELEGQLYWYRAQVLDVVDGDTMKLFIDMGLEDFRKPKKGIRLAVVNTPETYGVKKDSEEYKAGKIATARVEELAPAGSTVFIHTTKSSNPGKYGRYIVEVYVEQENDEYVCLNDLLIEEGLGVEVEY